jgi:hypothetical protein
VGAARPLIVAAALGVAAASASAAGETLLARVACRDGAPNGAFELRSDDGRLRATGAFGHGSKTGTFIFWTAAGARSAVVPYDQDARTGTVALWHTRGPQEAGRSLEVPYREGQVNGVVRSFYPGGADRGEYRFDAGRLVAAKAWSAQGRAMGEAQAGKLAASDLADAERVLARLESAIAANLPHCS